MRRGLGPRSREFESLHLDVQWVIVDWLSQLSDTELNWVRFPVTQRITSRSVVAARLPDAKLSSVRFRLGRLDNSVRMRYTVGSNKIWADRITVLLWFCIPVMGVRFPLGPPKLSGMEVLMLFSNVHTGSSLPPVFKQSGVRSTIGPHG